MRSSSACQGEMAYREQWEQERPDFAQCMELTLTVCPPLSTQLQLCREKTKMTHQPLYRVGGEREKALVMVLTGVPEFGGKTLCRDTFCRTYQNDSFNSATIKVSTNVVKTE